MSETQDTKRFLITRIKRRNTLSGGKPVVDLYAGGKDSKLHFPVLTLFDLSELAVVGIDPNSLNGQEVACRFWAYYAKSDKLNTKSNPYRDVDHLEAIAAPASRAEAANVDAVMEALDKVYDELAAVREELGTLRAEMTSVFTLLKDRLSLSSEPQVVASAAVEAPPADLEPMPAAPAPAKATQPAATAAPAKTPPKATPTMFWTLARTLKCVDDATGQRLAAEAAKSGDWATAIQQLEMAAAPNAIPA